MKYKSYLIGFVAISLVMMVFCNKNRNKKFIYKATVFEKQGGPPVKNVSVELWACSGRFSGKENCDASKVGQATTDDSGNFEISSAVLKNGRYMINLTDGLRFKQITKRGYPDISEEELKSDFTELFMTQ